MAHVDAPGLNFIENLNKNQYHISHEHNSRQHDAGTIGTITMNNTTDYQYK